MPRLHLSSQQRGIGTEGAPVTLLGASQRQGLWKQLWAGNTHLGTNLRAGPWPPASREEAACTWSSPLLKPTGIRGPANPAPHTPPLSPTRTPHINTQEFHTLSLTHVPSSPQGSPSRPSSGANRWFWTPESKEGHRGILVLPATVPVPGQLCCFAPAPRTAVSPGPGHPTGVPTGLAVPSATAHEEGHCQPGLPAILSPWRRPPGSRCPWR